MVLKSDKLYKSKQSSLRGTECFLTEDRFTNHLRLGNTFIACVETKNLRADKSDDSEHSDILRFLNDEYHDQFIWVTATSLSDARRSLSFKEYDEDFIEIPDLNFGANRKDPIRALCPMSDILTVLLFEEKNKLSVLFNKKCLKMKNHRGKQYLKSKTDCINFFQTKNTNMNKENVNPSEPGTSGLQSKKSSSNKPSSNRPSSKKPTSNNPSSTARNQSERSGSPDSERGRSFSSSASQVSANQVSASQLSNEKNADQDESSDENDSEDDQTRKIVFRHGFAEVTSKEITKKIEIGSLNDYPRLKSTVRFEFEIFQSLLTISYLNPNLRNGLQIQKMQESDNGLK